MNLISSWRDLEARGFGLGHDWLGRPRGWAEEMIGRSYADGWILALCRLVGWKGRLCCEWGEEVWCHEREVMLIAKLKALVEKTCK